MTQLKILNWNVNQRSGLGKQIPDVVVNELKHLDADVVCLTEYKNHFEFCEQLKSLGYSLFMYPYYIERFNSLSYNRKLPLLVKDAKERLLQIEYITEYVRKLNGKILLMGDFNNFHYFEHQKTDSWEHDKEFLQNYYSYPLVVEKMNEVNLATYSPTGNYDEVYSWINPKIRADNIKRYIRNDHLFSNLAEISDIKYIWEFTKNPNYQNKVGFPDHAILSATISL